MKSITLISSGNKKALVDVTSRLMRIFVLLAFVLTLSIPPAFADAALNTVAPDWLFPAPQDSKITVDYVTTKLLPQLIGNDSKLAQRLGFHPLVPINTPIVDPHPPFAVFHVGLSRLKTFNPAQSPFLLLAADENWFQPSSMTVMPVRFLYAIRELPRPGGCPDPSGCIASSVQVKRLGDKWDFQQIGRPWLISQLTKWRSATDFVVWIPALNVHYLAKFALGPTGPALKIKAIAEDHYVEISPGVKFKPGDPEMDANNVFGQLKAVATSIPLDVDPG